MNFQDFRDSKILKPPSDFLNKWYISLRLKGLANCIPLDNSSDFFLHNINGITNFGGIQISQKFLS